MSVFRTAVSCNYHFGSGTEAEWGVKRSGKKEKKAEKYTGSKWKPSFFIRIDQKKPSFLYGFRSYYTYKSGPNFVCMCALQT